MLPLACYALLVAAWILDLFTPQLFVAAILFNVPIALSSLAMRRKLTISLVVASEVANVAAGYVNALQAHHFDIIAFGDRALLAASFVLIGFMTIKTQELGRTAGLSDARAEQAQRERRLRIALDHVRESLNAELVLRAIVREAIALLGAERAMLLVEAPSNDAPLRYVGESAKREIRVERSPLAPEIRSILARDMEVPVAMRADGSDTIARYALESVNAREALIAPLQVDSRNFRLLLISQQSEWERDDARLLRSFAEQCETALAQSDLYMRTSEQAEQIVEQHDALIERSNIIRDLVFALAHDLRTPLAAADATMQQALRGEYGELPQTYRNVLATSLRSNDELRRMVETLLVVARYESGEASTIRDRVDLSQIASEAVEEIQAAAHERNLRLSVKTVVAPVLADADELRRAILNLIANAIAASSPGTQIGVQTGMAETSAFVVVEDEGFGIAPEDRSRLFQRFSAGTRRRGAGTGLGLYIVRLIAEKHGGEATYEPKPIGSRFVIRLPKAA